MHSTVTFSAAAVALLSMLPAAHGFYSASSPVLQVNAKNYDQLVAKSNHTTILEFFAPWCGHCQNLKPAYEKAARSLDGIAHVAAIDCDDDANKAFCGMQGVKGFPTLKIVRPGKKTGRPVIEDYQGARTASGIVEAVKAKINNHVTKVTDNDLESFLASSDKPKALLFTDKGTTNPLLKSIAIDFLGVITVGQVRNKEAATVQKYGVESFPTLLLIPADGGDPIKYDSKMNKNALVKFLSQAGAPNPDPAPSTAPKKAKKGADAKAKAKKTKEDESADSEKPTPAKQTAPVIVETAVPIPTINTPEKLAKECLNEKSNTCVLAIVPAGDGNEKAKAVLDNLSELAFRHAQSQRRLFPFFAVPASNEAATGLVQALELSGDVQLIATNARRGWWRHYEGDEFSHEGIESWIDAIRMSEGAKKKLPESLVASVAAAPSAATESDASETTKVAEEATASATEEATDETAAAEKIKHEEL